MKLLWKKCLLNTPLVSHSVLRGSQYVPPLYKLCTSFRTLKKMYNTWAPGGYFIIGLWSMLNHHSWPFIWSELLVVGLLNAFLYVFLLDSNSWCLIYPSYQEKITLFIEVIVKVELDISSLRADVSSPVYFRYQRRSLKCSKTTITLYWVFPLCQTPLLG